MDPQLLFSESYKVHISYNHHVQQQKDLLLFIKLIIGQYDFGTTENAYSKETGLEHTILFLRNRTLAICNDNF